MNIAIKRIRLWHREMSRIFWQRENELQHCITGKETYFDAYGKTGVLSFVPDEKQNAPQRSPIIHWKWNQMGQYARSGHILTGRTRTLSRQRNFWCSWQKQLTRKLNKEDKILSLKSRDLRKERNRGSAEKESKGERIWLHWKAACGYPGRGFDGERRIKW